MIEDKLDENGEIMHWVFHPSRLYFFYDSEGYGFVYYATEAERDIAVKKSIKSYLDGYWDESVTEIVIGKITHSVLQVDRVERPESVNDEGVDDEGEHWDDDIEYKCNYGVDKIN